MASWIGSSDALDLEPISGTGSAEGGGGGAVEYEPTVTVEPPPVPQFIWKYKEYVGDGPFDSEEEDYRFM